MAVGVDEPAGPEDGGPRSEDDLFPLAGAVFLDGLPDRWLLALDPASVPGQWAEAGMVAAFRADNHAAWRRLRWIWEAARASAGTTVRVVDRWRAGKIPAGSLGCSEQLGAARIEFARQVLVRLPALGEAMRVGRLEESKAAVFVSTVADLDDAQARVVVARLLGMAPELTHARLRARVESTAKAVDPGWAEARKAAAIARRRMVLRVAPSGAAELSGLDLPPEPAQDAYDRIVALADVVHDRLRAVGREAPAGPIQTEVLMVLTGPDGAGMFDDDVIELVEARFTDPDPDDNGPDDNGPGEGPDSNGPDSNGPDSNGPDDRGPDGDGPGPGSGPDDRGPGSGRDADGHPRPDGDPGPERGLDRDPGPDSGHGIGPDGDSGLDDGPGLANAGAGLDGGHAPDDEPGHAHPRGPHPNEDHDRRHGPADGDSGRSPDDDAEGPQADAAETEVSKTGSVEADAGHGRAPRAVPFRARVAIRLGLRTALGLDHRPGEVPGHGSVCHSTATTLAWARTQSTWRASLYDDHHHLEYVLTVRPPATGPPDAAAGRRGRHIVELTAHTRELDDLTAGTGLADLPLGGILGADGVTLLARAARALAAARARPSEQHPSRTTADAHRRHPGAELTRWVQARDRTCRGIGCAHQALGADLDHTLDWVHGGQSTADDLGVLCQADHLFKHDPRSGWTLTQPEPGIFVWTAPTGARHTVTPEPYDPLPEPRPPADGAPYSLPPDIWAPPPRTPAPHTPRRNLHGHITNAARATADVMTTRHREREGTPPSRYDADPDF